MKCVTTTIFLLFLSLFASAEDAPLQAKIENIPFKTCSGIGTNMMSEYANQKVTVNFNKDSIQVVNASGKKKTYFSIKRLCDINLDEYSKYNVVCSAQVDEVNVQGNNYTYSKKCSIPLPGVPGRNVFYRYDLEVILNINELNGIKTAGGWLSCVVDDDGFHGIELSNCK